MKDGSKREEDAILTDDVETSVRHQKPTDVALRRLVLCPPKRTQACRAGNEKSLTIRGSSWGGPSASKVSLGREGDKGNDRGRGSAARPQQLPKTV